MGIDKAGFCGEDKVAIINKHKTKKSVNLSTNGLFF